MILVPVKPKTNFITITSSLRGAVATSFIWIYCSSQFPMHFDTGFMGACLPELQQFHGTRENDPREIYDSDKGFDMRFSAPATWGQANYFAVNGSYSDNYAHTNTNGQKEMFLAKVLTGDSYQCGSDHSLCMPPLKISQYSSTGGVQLH